MAPVTFTYFPVRGRGFIARSILSIAGVDFENKLVAPDEWPALKPTTPFGQLPIYEEEGLGALTQSDVIHRYLAEKHGLFGKNAIEKARIDEAYEIVNELFQAVMKAHFVVKTDEAKAEVLSATVPKYVKTLKTLLERNGNNGFLVGDSITLADVQAFHALNNLVRPLSKEAIAELQSYLDGVRKSNEGFSKFLKESISATSLPSFAGFAHLPELFAGEFDN